MHCMYEYVRSSNKGDNDVSWEQLTLQVPAMPLNLNRPRLHTSTGTLSVGKSLPEEKASFHTRLARRLPPAYQICCFTVACHARPGLWRAMLAQMRIQGCAITVCNCASK